MTGSLHHRIGRISRAVWSGRKQFPCEPRGAERRNRWPSSRRNVEIPCVVARKAESTRRKPINHREHREHGEVDCPVCGVGRLDESWRSATEKQIAELHQTSAAYEKALSAVKTTIAEGRRVVENPGLDLPPGTGFPVDGYEAALRAWRTVPEQPRELAAHLRNKHPPVYRW